LNGDINYNEIFKDEEIGCTLGFPVVASCFVPVPSINNVMTPTNLHVTRNVAAPPSIEITGSKFDFEHKDTKRVCPSSASKKRARARGEDNLGNGRSSKKANISSDDSQSQQTIVRGSWSSEEDEMLRALVAEATCSIQSDSVISWTMIASKMKTRSAKQCRERWILNLDPSINHEPFLPHEDAILISACSQLGPRWTKIKTLLPGRTENSVKTRFKSLMRKSNLHLLPLPNMVRDDQTLTSTVI